jgi:hypothetical protein
MNLHLQKNKPLPKDLNRINFTEPSEVYLWKDQLKVSIRKLEEAVINVGVSVDAVRKYLGK